MGESCEESMSIQGYISLEGVSCGSDHTGIQAQMMTRDVILFEQTYVQGRIRHRANSMNERIENQPALRMGVASISAPDMVPLGFCTWC